MQQRFIAHRGYSACYMENTAKAFQAALDFEPAQRVVGIEFDIRATADGEIVIFHDTDLKRLCSCDLDISQTPYQKILEVTSGSAQFENETIPLLRDVLSQIDHRKKIYCEIKGGNYNRDLFLERLVELLADYNAGPDMILHSFSCEILKRVINATKHLGPEYGFLFGSQETEQLPAVFDQIGNELDYLHPHFECLIEKADQLCKYGKKFNTWTVNKACDVQRLLNLEQADMIENFISDDISLAKLDF